jgi:ABC-type bacteriocin/lantibiotic exporter with double-glycine peptidase domain
MFVQAGDVAQVPFIVVVCFGFLYYYLSWAFFAGFGVFVAAFIVNTVIGIYLNKNQKIVMEKKDERMVETNESLNNIKMLKLYSWQELFEQRIQ